jgi:ammonium transporter
VRITYHGLSAAAALLVGTPLWALDTPGTSLPPVTELVKPDSGDTAWMLMSAALVMLMLPGLALFYAGMVRRKNVLATMMHSMVTLAIVGVSWVAFGYGLAFGPPVLGQAHSSLLGWSDRFLFLQGVLPTDLLPGTGIPLYLHVIFQGMFAIITPALISGALAERIRFKPYCLFLILWTTFVYCPLAHWVWAMDWWNPEASKPAGTTAIGWLGSMGALDFAGGTVVHIAAGLSGLAAILLLRKRHGYPETAMRPNSLVLTLTGAGLLWFGWFGFNGGSALGSSTLAVSAFAASQAAAAAAGLSWMGAEWLHRGKPTALGLASGIVAGLVAVTPASGFIYPWAGLIIGLIAGLVCYGAICLKPLFRYDDSLDVFGIHGIGGFLGAALTGFFCAKAVNPTGSNGFFLGGGLGQVGIQLLASLTAVVYAFVCTAILVKFIDYAVGFTTSAEEETEGLDMTEHGEIGFDYGPGLESVTEGVVHEPRPANFPRDGLDRYTLVIQGVSSDRLIQVWSDMCQTRLTPPSPEFKEVYAHVTTVQGNRFRFRGGDPARMSENLSKILEKILAGPYPKIELELSA